MTPVFVGRAAKWARGGELSSWFDQSRQNDLGRSQFLPATAAAVRLLRGHGLDGDAYV